MTSFFKVGDRIVNINQITSIVLNAIGDDGQPCVEINLGEETLYFYEREGEIIERFMMHGSRTSDLNNLYSHI